MKGSCLDQYISLNQYISLKKVGLDALPYPNIKLWFSYENSTILKIFRDDWAETRELDSPGPRGRSR